MLKIFGVSQQPHAETNKYSNHPGTENLQNHSVPPPLEPPSVRPLGPKRKQMKRCFLFYISSIRLHHNRFFSHSPPKICSEISQLRSKTNNYVMQSSQSPRAKQVATSGIACLFMRSNTAPNSPSQSPFVHKRKMKQVAVATHSTSLQESSKRVRWHYTNYSLPRRGPLK